MNNLDGVASQAADLANAAKGLEMFANQNFSAEVSIEERDALIGLTAAVACLARIHYQALDEVISQQQGEDVAKLGTRKPYASNSETKV